VTTWVTERDLVPVESRSHASVEAIHARAKAEGADCDRCPLKGCDRGPVPSSISRTARLVIVAEAPGSEEVERRENLVGKSGREVTKALSAANFGAYDYSKINAIACQPPKGQSLEDYLNELRSKHRRDLRRWSYTITTYEEGFDGAPGSPDREPWSATKRLRVALKRAKRWAPRAPGVAPLLPAALTSVLAGTRSYGSIPAPVLVLPTEACAPRVEREVLSHEKARVFLGLGSKGWSSLTSLFDVSSSYNLKNSHGAPIEVAAHPSTPEQPRWILGTYHPAFGLRDSPKHMPFIRANIGRAARIAGRGYTLWKEPPFLLNPSFAQVRAWLVTVSLKKVNITCDTEGDSKDAWRVNLRDVGLGYTGSDGREFVIVIPVRLRSGELRWTPEEWAEISRLLRQIMRSHEWTFQNGQYDTIALIRDGLWPNTKKTWTDTLIAHHDTRWNDNEHGLGFLVRQYFEAPPYKADPASKKFDGTDADRWLYCARDVLGTMRLRVPLKAEIQSVGNWKQYNVDCTMAPYNRDLSSMGLTLSELDRGERSFRVNAALSWVTAEMQEIVGARFNPGSADDIKDILFDRWGIEPVLVGPEERFDPDLHEEEDASVGSAALTSIVRERKEALKPEQRIFIELLFAHRAYHKLRGTYIDNVPTYPIDREEYARWCQANIPSDWHADKRSQTFVDGRAPAVVVPQYDWRTGQVREVVSLPERPLFSLVRSTFKNYVTPTGRLSSGEPVNLQNISARTRLGNMRSMYHCLPGMVFVGADYDQLEARLYALRAVDRILLRAILKKYDLHTLNAAALKIDKKIDRDIYACYERLLGFKKTDPGEYKYVRTVAKRFAFLKIYGGKKNKLYSVMISDRDKSDGSLTFPNLTEPETWAWSDSWDELHPETAVWHAAARHRYESHGYIWTPNGRKRFFPGYEIDSTEIDNAIANVEIQGWAGDLATEAQKAICDAIPFHGLGPYTGMVVQVHDFFMTQVPRSRGDFASRVIENAINRTYDSPEGVIPIGGTAVVSNDWAAQG
jgi:DNA polymerase I-like protein with 3'-5' exonuclease and polymerase domains/uracil-DNA glycosylase